MHGYSIAVFVLALSYWKTVTCEQYVLTDRPTAAAGGTTELCACKATTQMRPQPMCRLIGLDTYLCGCKVDIQCGGNNVVSPAPVECLGSRWNGPTECLIRYYFIGGTFSWAGARNACNSEGGRLAILKNEQDHNQATQALQSAQPGRTNLPIIDKAFIGLSRKDINSTWTWIDNSAPAYFKWRQGEPQNRPNLPQDCVAVVRRTDSGSLNAPFEWINVDCDYTFQAGALCEHTYTR